jgi:hypothetical protein
MNKEIHGQSKELRRPNWVCVTSMTESEVFFIDFVVITQTYPLFRIEFFQAVDKSHRILECDGNVI